MSFKALSENTQFETISIPLMRLTLSLIVRPCCYRDTQNGGAVRGSGLL